MRIVPILQALLAALLFGASAPISKSLVGKIEPVPLAALLYIGSGVALLAILGLQRLGARSVRIEAKIRRSDVAWLVGGILAGGVAAPIVLLLGLRATPAATASLLLGFEGAATAVIAAVVFKEAISRRAWWAIFSITIASIILSVNTGSHRGISWGAAGILSACVLWGIDNNLTRNISAKDPLTIGALKGLGAGAFSLVLAVALGCHLPGFGNTVRAMTLGGLSYGLSIVLFIRAMRALGAARTSALFGTAPVAGVALSFVLFHEMPGRMFIAAVPLMVAGALMLINEKHGHTHAHESAAHDHRHSHDDGHHDHCHGGAGRTAESHAHPHAHSQLEHEHDHMPDIHHRHTHP